jgi:hypothetical protein
LPLRLVTYDGLSQAERFLTVGVSILELRRNDSLTRSWLKKKELAIEMGGPERESGPGLELMFLITYPNCRFERK